MSVENVFKRRNDKPKVKVMICDDKRGKESRVKCSPDATYHGDDIVYEVSKPRTASYTIKLKEIMRKKHQRKKSAHLPLSEASTGTVARHLQMERVALAQLAFDGAIRHKDQGQWYDICKQEHRDAVD
ncbi:hypothetical protein OS493_000279 [Desmophyllum pertusum]|uniref:Uncharacterized protein n=1 Tax=Desmophyllum pertusum TaxID=174260 RepID=A0A9X0DD80_9CNID|nr:hypothetical protein OS493_000279 [Desmophyllum pertusum]